MWRREFLGLLGGSVLYWSCEAYGQNQNRPFRVGFLRASPPSAREFDAFKRGLAEKGFAEGRDFVVVPGWAEGEAGQLPQLAALLLGKNVHVVVTEGSVAVLAARAVSPTMPIVFARVADPLPLVSSLARPGGNVTGFSSQGVDITGKMIEVLKELVPTMSRVALIGPPVARSIFGETVADTARALGLESTYIELTNPDSPGDAIRQAISTGASGSIWRGAPYFSSHQRRLAAVAAAEHKFPTVYDSRENVEQGGLVSYAADGADLFRRAGEYVAKILTGTNAGDLPVQQPTKFELVINAKAAKALGINLPSRLLFTADEVIE